MTLRKLVPTILTVVIQLFFWAALPLSSLAQDANTALDSALDRVLEDMDPDHLTAQQKERLSQQEQDPTELEIRTGGSISGPTVGVAGSAATFAGERGVRARVDLSQAPGRPMGYQLELNGSVQGISIGPERFRIGPAIVARGDSQARALAAGVRVDHRRPGSRNNSDVSLLIGTLQLADEVGDINRDRKDQYAAVQVGTRRYLYNGNVRCEADVTYGRGLGEGRPLVGEGGLFVQQSFSSCGLNLETMGLSERNIHVGFYRSASKVVDNQLMDRQSHIGMRLVWRPNSHQPFDGRSSQGAD